MLSEQSLPIVVEPVCEHANAIPTTEYRETPDGNILVTKEVVCTDCGAKAWFLTQHGPTQKLMVPLTWNPQVAMESKARIQSNGNGAKKQKPTAEQVVTGIRHKLGEGPGTELAVLHWQRGLVASCKACDDLAKRMNEWGAGCRDRLDEIVDEILPRAQAWVAENRPDAIRAFVEESSLPQSVKNWLDGKRGAIDKAALAAGAIVDVETPVIRRKVRAMVVEALDNFDKRG